MCVCVRGEGKWGGGEGVGRVLPLVQASTRCKLPIVHNSHEASASILWEAIKV